MYDESKRELYQKIYAIVLLAGITFVIVSFNALTVLQLLHGIRAGARHSNAFISSETKLFRVREDGPH